MTKTDWITAAAATLYGCAALMAIYEKQWGKMVYFIGGVILTIGVIMQKG